MPFIAEGTEVHPLVILSRNSVGISYDVLGLTLETNCDWFVDADDIFPANRDIAKKSLLKGACFIVDLPACYDDGIYGFVVNGWYIMPHEQHPRYVFERMKK